MPLIQAIMIGILITAPTGLAILICSRGNAADRHGSPDSLARSKRWNNSAAPTSNGLRRSTPTTRTKSPASKRTTRPN